MQIVDSCIDDRDNAVASTGGDIPCLGRVNVGIVRSQVLSRVMKIPLLVKARIRRYAGNLDAIVRLGIDNERIGLEGRQRFAD